MSRGRQDQQQLPRRRQNRYGHERDALKHGAAIYRKQSEVELRESEERYHRLSEAAMEGIFIHDHGIVLEANSALVHMFGYLYDAAVRSGEAGGGPPRVVRAGG